MHDIVLVEDLEGIEELFKNKKSLLLGQSSLLFENAFQSAPITVFVNKVTVIRGFQHIDILDDVFVLFYVGENVDFIDCAFFELLVLFESSDFDDFDGVLFIIVFVDRPVDLSISSFTDNFVQCVVFDDSNHSAN